jgi:hypothetical protein
MANKNPTPEQVTVTCDRVLHFAEKPSRTAARALLNFGFSSAAHEHMATLGAKARAGTLTADEEKEAEAFEQLGCVLDILHSAAREPWCDSPDF